MNERIKDLLVKHSAYFDFHLILFFEIKTNFFGNVLSACFFTVFTTNLLVTCKNNFSLLCFCFKNLDLLDRQTTQFDFSLRTLFVIFTSCGLKLWVKPLHPKQHVVPSSLPIFIRFIFDCVFFIFYNVGSIFFNKIHDN